MYHGDIRLGESLYLKFTTVNTSGVPTTLAGTPAVSAYPDDSLTQLTAGITLTVDFDGVTGLNHLTIVATSGNGYATATDYELVITTGTVGGSSVVGYVVGSFSIENRSALMPTTAARTLDVAATGEAGVDFSNINGTLDAAEIGTGAITAAKFAAGAIDAAAIANGAIDAATFAAGAIDSAAIATGAIDADAIAAGAITAAKFAAGAIDAAAIAADAIGASELAADAVAEIADAVWDEALSGHTTLATFGQVLNALGMRTGEVNDVAATTTVFVVDGFTEATNDHFNGSIIVFTSGALTGQARTINDYTGATQTITLGEALTDAPANNDDFVIIPGPFQGGTLAQVLRLFITILDQSTGQLDSGSLANDTITAASIATDAIGAAELADGAITAATFAAGAIDAAALAADAGTEIAAAVWDRDATLSQTQGTFGQAIGDPAADTGTIYKATVTDATGVTVGTDTATLLTRMGTPADLGGGATVAANLSDIEAQTDDIGAAGAGLTAVPWNAAWDAEVQSEVDDALVARFLHNLVMANGTADSGSTTTMVDAALTQADTDYWKGAIIVFTSGTIAGQARLITAFTPATDTVTFAPATTQAVGTNTYIIVPAGRADLQLWQGTAPNALVSGRVDSDVGNMQAGTVTAAVIATDAVDADAIAADAVTEIQAGLATASALSTVQADTDDIQTRLPAALVGGRMDSSVGAMAANTLTAAATAADFLAEINAEVVDVMATDTITLPGQAAPPLAPTHREMISWLYKVLRNRQAQTATQWNLYADNETTIDTKATVSDDGTTAIRQELVSGP